MLHIILLCFLHNSLCTFVSRNPQVDLQAQDRAHRIGQKKEVQVFHFCTEVQPYVSMLNYAI